jgi:L-threonylcarbamoyladenylate synthase
MSSPTLTGEDALRLQECVAAGGVAVFPSDTVYGVCCDPDNHDAARRMYELKGRPAARSCAVMFFQLSSALEHLEGLTEPERLALGVLLPGPLTLLLANRSMSFAAACRNDPTTLGLRVPRLPESLVALERVECPVMQSSANLSGEPDARSLREIPQSLLEGADLVLDGGELPGRPSTVVDLRDFDQERRWHVLREGALPRDSVQEKLAPLAA